MSDLKKSSGFSLARLIFNFNRKTKSSAESNKNTINEKNDDNLDDAITISESVSPSVADVSDISRTLEAQSRAEVGNKEGSELNFATANKKAKLGQVGFSLEPTIAHEDDQKKYFGDSMELAIDSNQPSQSQGDSTALASLDDREEVISDISQRVTTDQNSALSTQPDEVIDKIYGQFEVAVDECLIDSELTRETDGGVAPGIDEQYEAVERIDENRQEESQQEAELLKEINIDDGDSECDVPSASIAGDDEIEPLNEDAVQKITFEKSLLSGLWVQKHHLQKQNEFWFYRKHPVFVFSIDKKNSEAPLAHLIDCPMVQELPDDSLWVSTDLAKAREAHDSDSLNWCPHCLAKLNYLGFSYLNKAGRNSIIEGLKFKHFVARYSDLYFPDSELRQWQPSEEIAVFEQAHTLTKCDNCHWQPEYAGDRYLVGQDLLQADATLCVNCTNSFPQLNILVGQRLLADAKYQRYMELRPYLENWDQLREHLPHQWHSLTYHLQAAGTPLPSLYEETPGQPEVISLFAWKEAKRYIVENYEGFEPDDDLEVWAYDTLLAEFE